MQYAIEIGSNCNFQASQGSVATHLRCGEWPCNSYIYCFFGNLSVKELWKSVCMCRSC